VFRLVLKGLAIEQHVRTVASVVWIVALGVFVACGSNPAAPSASTVTVTGNVRSVGQTSQLTATVRLSNGSTQDVTTQATWSSSNISVATVTSGGLLRVLQIGNADITATYQGVNGKLSVSLVTEITITGNVPSVGQTSQLTATARLSNGSTQDVTTQATWSSSNTSVATVTSGGLLKVLQLGAADITATFQSVRGAISVVAPPPAQDAVTGPYTLRLSAGPECAVIPEIARNRTYSANIAATGADSYMVTLSDAVLLRICDSDAVSGLCSNQFHMSRDRDGLRVQLLDEGDDSSHGGQIVEQIPPGTWLSVGGSGPGRIDDSGIHATLDGDLWYCPTVMAYPFPCSAYVFCNTSNLQLTFTRR
jgi:hypothetical protein